MRCADEAYRRCETGYVDCAFALGLGTWTVLIELNGLQGPLSEPLTALSRGTGTISFQRHDNVPAAFVPALLLAGLITGVLPAP